MINLDIAASGMQAYAKNIEVLSNNIANSQTIGYKEQRIEFQDLMYDNVKRVGLISSDVGTTIPTGIQIGHGVNAGNVYRITTQGDLQETQNDTDVAIRGKGYFRVEMPNGDFAYTRAGAFNVNQNGEIVTSAGYLVSPGLIIPQDAIAVDINEQGQVFVKFTDQPDPQLVGQFSLYRFINEKGLEAIGDNLLKQSQSSGEPLEGFPGDVGFGTLKQKWLEYSNINLVSQITGLIRAQRAYEFCSTFIQAASQMMQTVNQIRSS
ncbi:MAG: flagellar basal-body rod protein FlgG [Alphaproteobacteria bacterium]|nr:flagellar basal-body rod protein FlgG [Alphaproteobacteria bacterium]OJV16023.1 MAG: flagellar basal-body rod protein FlgG [Alphaproteobacteria bacterium 33-17]